MIPYIVAVTGGVASGKSAVTRRFEALGVPVHDADLIARELVMPGQPALAEIRTRFGDAVFASDGSLDRRAMRERVFEAPAERRALEDILHPRVRAVLRARATGEGVGGRVEVPPNRADDVEASGPAVARMTRSYREADVPYVIVAIPLLAESGGDYSWLDRVLVVDVPRSVQHARLVARDGVDATTADAMIAAQANREQRLAIADDVVVNDGPISALDRAVATLHERYGALAEAHLGLVPKRSSAARNRSP